jgi:hypothetical protein
VAVAAGEEVEAWAAAAAEEEEVVGEGERLGSHLRLVGRGLNVTGRIFH